MKKLDEWATVSEVTEEDLSTATGRSLDEIAQKEPAKLNGKGARKATLPRQIKPMLATLVESPFDKPGWLFEVKWDGYRAIADGDVVVVDDHGKSHFQLLQKYQKQAKELFYITYLTFFVLMDMIYVLCPSGAERYFSKKL